MGGKELQKKAPGMPSALDLVGRVLSRILDGFTAALDVFARAINGVAACQSTCRHQQYQAQRE